MHSTSQNVCQLIPPLQQFHNFKTNQKVLQHLTTSKLYFCVQLAQRKVNSFKLLFWNALCVLVPEKHLFLIS
jgi:hypothetical protein